MLGLGNKHHALLGVDFSAAAIKVLELGRSGSGYKVESFAVEPLPDGAVVDKECRDAGAIGAALERAVKRSGTRLKHCAMAVPSSTIITRTLRLSSKLSESELEGQVSVEADQYIPYNIEDVSIDFQVLGKNAANPDLLDVLVVASRREHVESRIAIAEAARLTPEVVDVEAYAVEHAAGLLLEQLPDREEKPIVAVVDVGSQVTSVYVMSQDQGVIYTREQDFGGRLLTEEIMRRYDMDMQQAGNAKIHGELPPDYAASVLEPFKQNMMDQVQRLLQYFYVTRPQDTIDQIFLGGGCASIPGIDEMLEEAAGIPVMIANPFRGVPLARRVNQQRFQNDAPATLTACGLAMRGFVG
ncbi:pilus assembly protein PilM [Thioalkalivibrio sp.]|uniref:pilus assembly protein PilM n=1 Tax=Thioalkalivibrio sp. TaxID=2093813 RepID=UPI0039759DCE